MHAADADKIENFIREAFENNSGQIRFKSGHALAPDTMEDALDQVLFYWRRLPYVAEKITETEVRLRLPNQTTPKGRRFNIEGVVDIVEVGERTIMYDLKTHDADEVRANLSIYEDQLNIYAYIWQKLRGLRLDGAAIVATRLPKSVKEARKSEDAVQLDKALKQWEPIIRIRLDPSRVEKAISKFGETVDSIEEQKFKAPRPESLKGHFAATVCANCDGRHSCDSFRVFSFQTRKRARRTLQDVWPRAAKLGRTRQTRHP